MLNVIELENRWLRYKIKSYLPHVTITISLLLITLIAYSFMSDFSSSASEKKELIATTAPIVQEKVVETKVITKEITPAPVVERTQKVPTPIHRESESKKTMKLSPSLDFMKKMQNSVQPYYVNEHPRRPVKKPVVRAPKVERVPKAKQIVKVPKKQEEPQRINIKRQNTQNDIQEIVKRFKTNNNPALSLFVAKKYYELGNYNQAYNYALITNQINKDIDVSWIIFTKSLVKLGKKDMAINTLKKYISQSHSNRAQILLDEIQSGKFQ